MTPVDMNDNPIEPGMSIVYANLWGRAAGLVLGEVVEVTPSGTVKVRALREANGHQAYKVDPSSPIRILRYVRKSLVL